MNSPPPPSCCASSQIPIASRNPQNRHTLVCPTERTQNRHMRNVPPLTPHEKAYGVNQPPGKLFSVKQRVCERLEYQVTTKLHRVQPRPVDALAATAADRRSAHLRKQSLFYSERDTPGWRDARGHGGKTSQANTENDRDVALVAILSDILVGFHR